jgi:hypothetical protein
VAELGHISGRTGEYVWRNRSAAAILRHSFFQGSERLANGECEGEKGGQDSGAQGRAEESASAFEPTSSPVGEIRCNQ